jgi:hypothetical protein
MKRSIKEEKFLEMIESSLSSARFRRDSDNPQNHDRYIGQVEAYERVYAEFLRLFN